MTDFIEFCAFSNVKMPDKFGVMEIPKVSLNIWLL